MAFGRQAARNVWWRQLMVGADVTEAELALRCVYEAIDIHATRGGKQVVSIALEVALGTPVEVKDHRCLPRQKIAHNRYVGGGSRRRRRRIVLADVGYAGSSAGCMCRDDVSAALMHRLEESGVSVEAEALRTDYEEMVGDMLVCGGTPVRDQEARAHRSRLTSCVARSCAPR